MNEKKKQTRKIQWVDPVLVPLGSAHGQGPPKIDCDSGTGAPACVSVGDNPVDSCWPTGNVI